ncbi:MAG: hypothetical protein WC725_02320 [Patescibacteria group bacterium]|jgi:hypothetical protein
MGEFRQHNPNLISKVAKDNLDEGSIELSESEAENIIEKLITVSGKQKEELESKLVLRMHYFIAFIADKCLGSNLASKVLNEQGIDKEQLRQDLISEGNIRLLKIYSKWEKDRGAKFSSYLGLHLEQDFQRVLTKFLTQSRRGKVISMSYNGEFGPSGRNAPEEESPLDNQKTSTNYKKQLDIIDESTVDHEKDLIEVLYNKEIVEKYLTPYLKSLSVEKVLVITLRLGLGYDFFEFNTDNNKYQIF